MIPETLAIREGTINPSDSARDSQEERQISDSSEGSLSVESKHLDRTTTEAVRTALEGSRNKQGAFSSDSIDFLDSLPTEIKQTFCQDDPEFGLFFWPIALEVTTKTGIYAFLESC